jgi:hypothetical protein
MYVEEETRLQQPSKFIVHVFAWKRYASLNRLLESLVHARYFGLQVELIINVEGNATSKVIDYVSAFTWPHGSLLVRMMANRQGLEKASL